MHDGTAAGPATSLHMRALWTPFPQVSAKMPAPLRPSRFFLQLLEQRLSAPDCQALGWLLDGFPHTKAQAARLAAAGIVPDKVVFLEAAHSMLMERVRWVGGMGLRCP